MQAVFTDAKERETTADLSSRFVALLIDTFLLLSLLLLVNYFTISSNENAFLLKPERVVQFLLGWLYFAGTETCPCQSTLGKYLMHLKVTNRNGGRLSFSRASVRYFAKPLTLLVMLMRFMKGAGLPRLPLLHDKLARARVVVR